MYEFVSGILLGIAQADLLNRGPKHRLVDLLVLIFCCPKLFGLTPETCCKLHAQGSLSRYVSGDHHCGVLPTTCAVNIDEVGLDACVDRLSLTVCKIICDTWVVAGPTLVEGACCL